MGVNGGVDVKEEGLQRNRDSSEGPICVVYASLHQYEKKIPNIAWRGPYIT